MPRVGRMVKEALVEEMGSALAQRPNVFITAINRLKASEADQLRRKLHASNARLLMVNRRLARRAIEPLKIDGFLELLEGSVGLIFADADVLPTAKLITEFRKSHEEGLSVRGAVVDGRLVDQRRVEELASLPPRPMLLAQVVAAIESPIADVIVTLERLIGDPAWLAEQAAEQKLKPTTGSRDEEGP